MTDINWTTVKDITEITKDFFVLIGSLAVALYFYYRLLAGFFILCRLAIEFTCDTPFSDKRLVKCTIKLMNTGPASIRIKDARLWIIKLEKDRLVPKDWKWPTWPDASKSAEPKDPRIIGDFSRDKLDFQRLSFDPDIDLLVTHQAKPPHEWLNLETAGEQQRMFLFNLEEGLYKIEFRIFGMAMFGGDPGLMQMISNRLFSLSRHSQWVATAVIEAQQTPAPGAPVGG